MYLLVCGEGSTDIGKVDCGTGIFYPSAMYYMIDKLIETKLSYSLLNDTPSCVQYVSRHELSEECRRLPKVFSKKQTPQGTISANKHARALANLAKMKQEELGGNTPVIAVLFHDTDGTHSSPSTLYSEIYNSMLFGLKTEFFDNGVPMIPKPKSEAWLLYCMDRFLSPVIFKQPNSYENLPGNDDSPNSAKQEYATKLANFGYQHEDICDRIKDTFDLMVIDLPSFVNFRTRLFKVVEQS